MSRRIAALALVVLAACSSGGSNRSSSDRSRADADWKAAAAAACDGRAAAIKTASAQLTAQSSAEQFAAWFKQFFEPAYRSQLDAQRAAGPPDDTARALVDDTGKVLDAMAADPGSFAVAPDPFADVDARWDAYGITACGSRTG